MSLPSNLPLRRPSAPLRASGRSARPGSVGTFRIPAREV